MIEETQGPSLAATVSKIVEDTQKLARQELGLARLQLQESTKKGIWAALSFSLGAASALVGSVALSVAVTYFLMQLGLSLGAASLIVAVIYFGAAIYAIRMSRKLAAELEAELSPKNLFDTEQENVRWLKK